MIRSNLCFLVLSACCICSVSGIFTTSYKRLSSSVNNIAATRHLYTDLIQCAILHASSCSKLRRLVQIGLSERNMVEYGKCVGFQVEDGSCILYSKKHTSKKREYDKNIIKMYLTATDHESPQKGPFDQECSSSSQCAYEKGMCLDGRCDCVCGYSYNYTLQHCVDRCYEYGDIFSRYKQASISGCNKEIIEFKHDIAEQCVYERSSIIGGCNKEIIEFNHNISEQCRNLCLKSTSMVCVNAEYSISTKQCDLCDLSLHSMQPEQIEYHIPASKGYDLYFRHCKN